MALALWEQRAAWSSWHFLLLKDWWPQSFIFKMQLVLLCRLLRWLFLIYYQLEGFSWSTQQSHPIARFIKTWIQFPRVVKHQQFSCRLLGPHRKLWSKPWCCVVPSSSWIGGEQWAVLPEPDGWGTVSAFPWGEILYGVLEFFPKIVLSFHVKGEYVLVNVLDIFPRGDHVLLPGYQKKVWNTWENEAEKCQMQFGILSGKELFGVVVSSLARTAAVAVTCRLLGINLRSRCTYLIQRQPWDSLVFLVSGCLFAAALWCLVCQIMVTLSWNGGNLLMEKTSLESLCCCWSAATKLVSASVWTKQNGMAVGCVTVKPPV